VVVVTGAVVVVVVGGSVVVVGGVVVVVVVVGGVEEVGVVVCAPALDAASPIRSGIEAAKSTSAARLGPPVFMTTAYGTRRFGGGTDVNRQSGQVLGGRREP
jgi:hypothetical protein